MVANGDGGRPIWVTEFGWAVGALKDAVRRKQHRGRAAAWLVKAYQMCKTWAL